MMEIDTLQVAGSREWFVPQNMLSEQNIPDFSFKNLAGQKLSKNGR